MATSEDLAVDEEDYDDNAIQVAQKASVSGVNSRSVGFRPDWNPQGFHYKRLESASLKKKDRLAELS